MKIVLIFLTIVILILSYIKRLKEFRSRNEFFVNTIIALFATFIGVYFAVLASDNSEQRKKEKICLNLLNATNKEFESIILNSGQLLESFKAGQIPDSTYFIINPIGKSKFVDILLSNEIFLANASSLTLNSLNSYRDNADKFVKTSQIQSFRISDISSFEKFISLIAINNYSATDFLKLEIRRISRNISNKEFARIHYQMNINALQQAFQVDNKVINIDSIIKLRKDIFINFEKNELRKDSNGYIIVDGP